MAIGNLGVIALLVGGTNEAELHVQHSVRSASSLDGNRRSLARAGLPGQPMPNLV
jgi:hypothetical protein